MAPAAHTANGLVITRNDWSVPRVFGLEEDAPLWADLRSRAADSRGGIMVGPFPSGSIRAIQTPSAIPYGELPPLPEGVVEQVSDDAVLTRLDFVCDLDDPRGGRALVVRELVWARLWQRLRAETAWSYTPSAITLGGRLFVDAEVLPGAEEAAIAAIRQEISALATAPLTGDELQIGRRRASVVASSGLALQRQWPSLIFGPRHVRGAHDLSTLPGYVSVVDADDVHDALATCKVGDGWLVTRPRPAP